MLKLILEEIENKQSLSEFLENARENPKILNKYFNKEQIKNLEKVLQEKKEKEREIKREFTLTCKEPNGITLIKKILMSHDDISYLGSSRFVIKKSSKNLKKLDAEITEIFNNIEKNSRKNNCEFQILKH